MAVIINKLRDVIVFSKHPFLRPTDYPARAKFTRRRQARSHRTVTFET
jgi:hypothetical protein